MEELDDAPTTCYALCPPQEQVLYENWVFRDVAPPCEDCFAFSPPTTPDMLFQANLHYLLCLPFVDLEGSPALTWSSIFRRSDRLHYIYIQDIRPFITSLPRLHVVLITNPSKLHSWEEGISHRRFSFGNYCRSIRPFWFTDTVGTFCRSAGCKSARACILRQSILMPLLDSNLPFCRITTRQSYVQYKTTYHLIAEILVEFLLGPGPCLRPLPAITALRRKGYIPGTSKLRSASFAIDKKIAF